MRRWLLVVALAACAPAGAGRHETSSRFSPSLPREPRGARAAGNWVDSTLAAMTVAEKAGQMVWPTVLGDFQPDGSAQWRLLRRYITEHKVGGFTVSVGSPTEVAVKLNAMQRLSAVPLLIGADYEFGAGYRARGGYFVPNGIDLGGAVVFPPEMAVGAAGDTSLAYEQGRVTAVEGRAIGVHYAYAPILDVNNNPDNPVINVRAYGEDPGVAARMGRNFVRGLQEHGMVATGKHFPGHGDTDVNSHLALPSVNVSRARLDSVELVPFRAAVEGGMGAVMSFHGAMPALDSSGVPGTLSRKVLTGLLRDELRFTGIIISDAMDMRGVLDTYGAAEATKRAVAAGADILIEPENVEETIRAVVAGVREGRYPESRLDASVRRILESKRRLGLDRRRLVDVDSLRAIVDDSSHRAAARRVAERSITLVKDSLGVVPLRASSGARRVLSVSVGRRNDLAAGVTFDAELRRVIGSASTVRREWVNAEGLGAEFAVLLRAADSADVVIVSSYMGQSWDASSASAPTAFTEFVRVLAKRPRPLVLVAFGNPYLLRQVPEVPAYLVAWGGFPVSQGAAARALAGAAPIRGRLPISIPPVAARGAGIFREVGR